MRVFLVGGTGYVGGHILTALLGDGHEVTVASRQAKDADLPAGATAVRADLKKPESYVKALRGHDAVVHAVGLIRNRRTRGQTFERVVAQGTRDLVASAKAAAIGRFVLISANGTTADGTVYQRTKWEAEEAVRASGIPFTILRPSIVFAPDDDFVNQMRRLMRLGAVPYFGRGDYELAPVHADDVGKAVSRALTRKNAVGKTWHVCGPESFTYKQFLKEVKAAAGSRALILPMPKWLVRTAAALLGWIPWFPATNAALTMLFEGNTCPEAEWARALDIEPIRFRQGIRKYL